MPPMWLRGCEHSDSEIDGVPQGCQADMCDACVCENEGAVTLTDADFKCHWIGAKTGASPNKANRGCG